MRKPLLTAALIWAAFWMGGRQNLAQQQSPPSDSSAQQKVPDAPQPRKKPAKPAAAAKPSSPSPGSSSDTGKPPVASPGQSANQPSTPPAKPSAQPPSSTPHPASNGNPFPEDVSRKAAQAAGNAPADGGSSSAPSPAKPSSAPPHSSADANPFPEDVSRKAAEATGKNPAGTEDNPKAPRPPYENESPGHASSLTGALTDNSVGSFSVADPIRAKKDTSVGDFYMGQGDYKGAYLRYEDGMKSDPANVDAIFGAAEAARRLGKLSEAARNYQMYLEIEPNGSKAKRALKALNALPAKN